MLIYFLLFSLLLMVVVYYKPGFAVAYILCLYGIKQLLCTQSEWFVTNHQMFYVIGGLLCIVALYAQYQKRQLRLGTLNNTHRCYLLLYSWSLLSISWSISPDDSIDRWTALAPHVIVAVGIAPLTIQTRGDLRTVIHGVVILGLPVVFATIFVGNFSYRSLDIETSRTVEGTINNPLMLARFAATVGTAIYFIQLPKGAQLFSFGRYITLAICAYLMIKAGARGEFLGLLAGIATVSVAATKFKLDAKNTISLLGLLIALLVLYYVLETQTKLSGRWSSEQIERSTDFRIRMISQLLFAWASSPLAWLFGLGTSASYSPQIIGVYCHNVPVEILAELGMIGLSIFLSCLLYTLASAKQIFSHNTLLPEEFSAAKFLAATSLLGLVISMKAGALLGSQELFMTHIVLASIPMLRVSNRMLTPRYTPPLPSSR